MPCVIANWDSAVFKPPIFPVEALQTLFELIGISGGDRSRKNFSETGQILRMYHSVCSPVPQFVEWPAKILDDLLIHGFYVAVRGQDRNKTGYPIYRRAQISLTLTQGLLGILALRHIDGRGHRLQQHALGREQVMAGPFKVFDCSIR